MTKIKNSMKSMAGGVEGFIDAGTMAVVIGALWVYDVITVRESDRYPFLH